jgi:hypothetical protein
MVAHGGAGTVNARTTRSGTPNDTAALVVLTSLYGVKGHVPSYKQSLEASHA